MHRFARARVATVPVAIVGLAAVLRLWAIGQAAGSPFYDAAVRSMAMSWHNFFFGALEPGASVSVDKAPVDLWFQVAAVKLLGFNVTALHLPEAIGGAAAVALLYVTIRPVFGTLAAALAALALAVLPLSVLTSRSDTMDSVMMAFLVAALWASTRALRTGRGRWVLVAAALIGVAFNIKLTQALVPLPALALMWWSVRAGRGRIALGASAFVILAVVALSWITTASLTPRTQRPYPIGSGNGSIYRVVFVFNGLDRLRGNSTLLAPKLAASQPGPTRLLRATSPFFGPRLGLEIVAALALALAALVAARRGPPGAAPSAPSAAAARTQPWLLASVVAWLAISLALFSTMKNLQPRYLETLSPAPAALIGISVALLLARVRERLVAALLGTAVVINAAFAAHALGSTSPGVVVCLVATVVALALLAMAASGARLPWRPRALPLAPVVAVALFAAPAQASIDLVSHNATDAPMTGTGAQLSPYLRSHPDPAHYEVASPSVYDIAALIARDARPVLVLNDVRGRLVQLTQLRRIVRSGALRYVVISRPCHGGPHCPATTRWALSHATLVRPPNLYRFNPGA